MEREGGGEDDIVCLDGSFFINDDYQLTKFTFGSQVLELFCLHSASTDFDLTGQLVWPGAMLLNDYLSKNAEILRGCSVIELGSGVGVTGILCSRFCCEVVLTDHNEEILNKNIKLHTSSENHNCTGLVAKKLEWGSSAQIKQILDEHSGGFDLLLHVRRGQCKFILAYVSRAKISLVHGFAFVEDSFHVSSLPPASSLDAMVTNEAISHGMQISEVVGTRTIVGNLEGVIYEITLQ
ncbi:hypothetical protein CK203_040454 [Vitis vinifera]|uniref:Protein N-lysine methyltransferase METTL21A n=1 Tax=Vitis vinifera TaxID=29760 RepID=A0A438I883_VITVI|nr:hypothetical protein CK203_040454 [Vitis vinifera]